MKKVIAYDELKDIRGRHPGQKIVHCHGVFDLFHYGHLLHLQSAKEFGDILVVTITQDQFVNKGPGRPYYTESKRLSMLSALEFVDYVCLNQFPKGTEAISALKPDVYVKGLDYEKREADITGGIIEEENIVKSVGGRIEFTHDESDSSSHIINRFTNIFDAEQREIIDKIRTMVDLEHILKEIESLSNLKILVVGEPIVDTYVFCRADALSSKSPTVAATQLYQEDHAGGTLAIANHLASLGCKVSMLLAHGNEPYFKTLLRSSMHENVKLEQIVLNEIPTPRKSRYLVPFRGQRIFELQNVSADHWSKNDPKKYIEKLKKLADQHDLVIMADFGHGLFEGEPLQALKELDHFVALNVQTNSGNFGFNPFTKHERFNYLSIDERESRIALQDRTTPINELASKVASYHIDRATSVTLGTHGSLYFDEMGESYYCPTFFRDIVDSTGAGDAYFALTSALVYMETPQIIIPFLGNCCAGLKTLIPGNKHAVSKTDLLRTVTALMK